MTENVGAGSSSAAAPTAQSVVCGRSLSMAVDCRLGKRNANTFDGAIVISNAALRQLNAHGSLGRRILASPLRIISALDSGISAERTYVSRLFATPHSV